LFFGGGERGGGGLGGGGGGGGGGVGVGWWWCGDGWSFVVGVGGYHTWFLCTVGLIVSFMVVVLFV